MLSNVPIVLMNDFRTHLIVGMHDVAIVFGVKLSGERSGLHEIAEQNGELSAFGVREGWATWRWDL